MNCENCTIEKCPFLDRQLCSIKKLWDETREAHKVIAEAERILKEARHES